MIDSPCGDCNWQWRVEGLNNVAYLGLDIVPGTYDLEMYGTYHLQGATYVRLYYFRSHQIHDMVGLGTSSMVWLAGKHITVCAHTVLLTTRSGMLE